MATAREKAEAALPTVKLRTPHGTVIKVPVRRANELLARHDIELPGGKFAGWERVDDDTPVKYAETADMPLVDAQVEQEAKVVKSSAQVGPKRNAND